MEGLPDMDSLKSAVSERRLDVVRELIGYFSPLCHSEPISGGYDLVLRAVENRRVELVKLLLTNGAKVNRVNNEYSDTPLHLAVKNADIDIVEVLLDAGADMEAINKHRQTPFHCTFKTMMIELIELLLNRGANVNANSSSDISPLVLAIGTDSEKFVKLLVSRGADINFKGEDGVTPLHIAVEKGNFQIIEHLLEQGASVNSASWIGESALHRAVKAKTDREDIIELLINRGANIDAKTNGSTSLHIAIEKGSLQIVKLLLSRGADIEIRSSFGLTCLHMAVKIGNFQIVKHLLEHGAYVNPTCKFMENKTPLHFAAEKDSKKIVRLLLNKGADIEAKASDGATPLHIAAEKGNCLVVEHLLERGAQVDSTYTSTYRKGYTPLHFAAKSGSAEVVNLLINKGANVDAKGQDGLNPLHLAAEGRSVGVIKVLLEQAADINSKSRGGVTPLHIACNHQGNERIVSALLEYGSDVNITDDLKCTPLDFASDDSMSTILERHIVKLKTADLYVSRANLQSIIYSSNDKIRNLRNNCMREISSLKNSKIGNSNISFYDILIKNKNQLVNLLKNENILQILQSTSFGFNFPIYAGMIYNNFRRGKKRKELIDRFNKNFYSVFCDLPWDCVEKVLDYLSDRDLSILIDICESTAANSSDSNQ